MPDGKDSLSERDERKKEEQGPLAKVLRLAPLLNLALHFLELILKIIGVVK
ncbi:MAG: hypothetical protein FWG71_11440 [Synergistaceae bacterium]|nr:hypothetical protein [Synergistaceae bacterium]